MTHAGLLALDGAFFVLHTALVVFNVLGWIPRRTRRWNLAALLATLFSWTVMGLVYGQGYCVLTDAHWRVRRELGIEDRADSYLVLLVRLLTGWTPPTPLVNAVAAGVFALSLTMSVALNLRDRRTRHEVALH